MRDRKRRRRRLRLGARLVPDEVLVDDPDRPLLLFHVLRAGNRASDLGYQLGNLSFVGQRHLLLHHDRRGLVGQLRRHHDLSFDFRNVDEGLRFFDLCRFRNRRFCRFLSLFTRNQGSNFGERGVRFRNVEIETEKEREETEKMRKYRQ